MSHTTVDVHDPASDAPVVKPRLYFLLLLGAAVISANAALLAAALLTLSLRSTQIDPDGATTTLSIVVGSGSLASLLAYPVVGRLSDRTLSRFGRRRPYMLLGALLLLAGACLTAAAEGVVMLAGGYIVTTVGAVSTIVTCTATVPDQVSEEHRGLPSAMLGLGMPVGALLGLFLAQLVQPHVTAMIFLPAGVAAAAAVSLMVTVRDRRITREQRPRFAGRDLVATFWVNPLRHPSFGLAWGSRFLIFFGVAAVNAYQAIYLISVHGIDPGGVGTALFVAALLSTGLALVFAPVLSKLSDRMGRRKPFVIVAAIVFAIGLAIVAAADTYAMFLIAVAVMGIGQSVYFAVDYALIMQVLPAPDNPAKDLGIMNLANSLPSSVVPAIAPLLLAIGATADHPDNFTALFIAGAIAAVLGAVLILPIKAAQ